MSTQIELIRTPQISHKLVEIGANVTARLNDLGIETLVATEDTVKGLKELRAELNKELTDFEEQRKFVKSGILKPYDEFESVYKTEVSEKYTNAINLLKDKIAVVETRIKDEKTLNVKSYFNELCLAESIDFLKWENLGIDINLSTTEKKYKEQVNAFITKTQDDIALIKSSEYEAETMAEYKKTLNVSQAITGVKTRKEQEKIEAERIKVAETNRRKEVLRKTGLVYLDITDSFEYDQDILISKKDVENLSKPEFEKKIIEIESQIASKRMVVVEAVNGLKTPMGGVPTPEEMGLSKPISAPVTPEPAEEIVTASFKVEATMRQLRALGQYMKDNKIKYSNI
jgi:hypothetical protein